MPLHVHELAHVAVILEGQFSETGLCGTERLLGKGDAAFYPAGHGHEVVFAGEATMVLSVALSSRMLADYGLGSRGQVIIRSGIPDRLPSDTKAFCGELPITGTALADLFLALDKVIGHLAARGQPGVWLDEVRRSIDASLDEPPSLAMLGHRCGRHPNYISQAFRLHFGVPIRRYIRRQRLLLASSELLAARCTVTEAAHRAGFADASQFARSFRAASSRSAMTVRDSDGVSYDVVLPAA